MNDFGSWFQSTLQEINDLDRQRRVAEVADQLRHALHTQRDGFQLSEALREIPHRPEEFAAAQDEVFRLALARAWADRRVTPQELATLGWVVEKIQIAPERARELEFDFARDYFAKALSAAIADGKLDASEEEELVALAANVGLSLADYARRFFRVEGQRFVQCVFHGCVADGLLTNDEWSSFWQFVAKIGVPRDEARAIIQPQAQAFVERVLIDAKADGRLSAIEVHTLVWLLENLGLSEEFRRRIRAEIDRGLEQTDWS